MTEKGIRRNVREILARQNEKKRDGSENHLQSVAHFSVRLRTERTRNSTALNNKKLAKDTNCRSSLEALVNSRPTESTVDLEQTIVEF
jgi:hypothetical protein